jgi:hypothetical protein
MLLGMLKMFPIGLDTYPTPSKHILAPKLYLFSGYMGNLKMNDFSESLFCVDIGSTDFPKG